MQKGKEMNTGSKIFWSIYILICAAILFFRSLGRARHFKTIQDAKRIYKRINAIQNDNSGWLLSYLRKIDPFVFEELILLAFKKKGFKVKRNKRYTHDGGIDGKCIRHGETFIIQAKRYSDYIKEEHVRQFIKVCHSNKRRGYFIHTGKTGNETKELIRQNPQIKLLSGESLYSLFLQNTSENTKLYF